MVPRIECGSAGIQGAYGAHVSSCLQSVDSTRLFPFSLRPSRFRDWHGDHARTSIWCHCRSRLVMEPSPTSVESLLPLSEEQNETYSTN